MQVVVQQGEQKKGESGGNGPARYAFIDALRGVAIFGVMALHTGLELHVDDRPAGDLIGLGNYGVQLFYVVSAFSLMMSLAYRARKNEPELMGHYFVRRFMRIAPMFYLGILIWLAYRALDPFGKHLHQPGAAQIATAAVFVNGWIPGHINAVLPGAWSVAIETNFYLLLPLAFRWVKSLRAAVIWSLVVWGAGAGASALVELRFPHAPDIGGFKFLWLPAQLGVFLLGVVLFFVFERVRAAGMARSRAHALLAASAVVFGVMAWVPKLPSRHYWVSVAFVMLAVSLGMQPNRFFVNRFWVLLGQVSFSAYLLHLIVVHGVLWILGGRLEGLWPVARFGVAFPCVVVLTMGVGWVTYRLVELPGQGVGKRIIKRMAGREKRVGADP